MKALFIGRFQPFHNGHLEVIKNISKQYSEIIIGIGSSQYIDTLENPFSSDERKQMIKGSLNKIGINNYKIIIIPDINNPPKWVDHVLSIYSDFDVIITNNSLTKTLFSEKGYTVNKTPYYNKEEFSGKEIRKRIINNKPWENLVPLEVKNVIIKIDGINRLKKISKQK